MSSSASRPSESAGARREAAEWLARRDRGLSAAEQDDYLQWLREDPDRAKLVADHEKSLRRLMRLSSWQPGLSAQPDPDLFAPRRRLLRYLAPAAAIAAAACVVLWRAPWREPAPSFRHLVVDEQRSLPDGSRVECKDGSALDVRYTPAERRVTLVGGEANFTVRKDAKRPFVVDAAGVAVLAVGTVFDVRLASSSVEVVVTEGSVRLEQAAGAPEPGAPVLVSAGQRAVVPLAPSGPPPQVARLGADEISDDLAWRAPRFQFFETPLGDVVAEFNRYNRRQLTLTDSRLRALPIDGTFRADNVEGFARILEATVGIRAEPDASGGFVLTGAR